ncbi:hypothetical protein C8J56DRAFT_965138 [Mycena floridula]|nr:hypothetical protein C8J56DRAFT_965138 [Mycena floridula]
MVMRWALRGGPSQVAQALKYRFLSTMVLILNILAQQQDTQYVPELMQEFLTIIKIDLVHPQVPREGRKAIRVIGWNTAQQLMSHKPSNLSWDTFFGELTRRLQDRLVYKSELRSYCNYSNCNSSNISGSDRRDVVVLKHCTAPELVRLRIGLDIASNVNLLSLKSNISNKGRIELCAPHYEKRSRNSED